MDILPPHLQKRVAYYINCPFCGFAFMISFSLEIISGLYIKNDFFSRFYLINFREKGREEEKHQCMVASHAPPTGGLARNPGMCPDWELLGAQSTEPHQPGRFIFFMSVYWFRASYNLLTSPLQMDSYVFSFLVFRNNAGVKRKGSKDSLSLKHCNNKASYVILTQRIMCQLRS